MIFGIEIAAVVQQEIVADASQKRSAAEEYFLCSADNYFSFIVQPLIAAAGKQADAEEVVERTKQLLQAPEVLAKWDALLRSEFTDEELQFLTACYTSEITKKCMQKQHISVQLFAELKNAVEKVLEGFPSLKQEVADEQPLAVVSVTDETFDKEVMQSEVPVVVKAYGVLCPPCKALAPVFSELGSQMQGRIKFVQFDAQKEVEIAKKLNVCALPTLTFVKDGKVAGQIAGLREKEAILIAMLEAFGCAPTSTP